MSGRIMTQEQWRAIRERDKRADGSFVYAPLRAKNVCRPSCTLRRCRPERVQIFASYEEAAALGYGPCRRCRPDQPVWRGAREELAAAAAALLRERFAEKFSLPSLARALHVDGSYLERTFHAVTGETLLACHNRLRCEQAAEWLKQPGTSITEIGLRAGFANSAHFSRVFRRTMGCSPSEYRKAWFARFPV